jgi:transcriptional regulator with XRE-family HTH domain
VDIRKPKKPITLRVARKRAGLNQEQLADLAQIDQSTISRIETIGSPQLPAVTRDALDAALRNTMPRGLRRDEVLTFPRPFAAPTEVQD